MLITKHNTDIFTFVEEGFSQAIGHGVNTQGVMGGFAGIIAKKYTQQCEGYLGLCRTSKLSQDVINRGLAIEAVRDNCPTIYHLVTQINPGADARIEYIKKSLTSAIKMAKERGLTSIAIPAIGTGIGGLDFEETITELTETFKDEDFLIYLCIR